MQPEKFAKKVRSVSACKPDLNVVIPAYPTVDAYTKEGSTKMITRDIIAEFENLYGKTLNLTLQEGTHTRYQDPQTEVIYRAFRMAFAEQRKAIQRAISAQKKSTVSGPFIIGMPVADGTVQFGRRPYRHSNMDKAQQEAQRLVASQKKSCVIFAAVAQVGDKETPWEMKPDMAFVPYKYERKRTIGVVQAELQAINKTQHPLTKAKNAIRIIELHADGSVLVVHNNRTSVDFDVHDEAIAYVDKWIAEYRTTLRLRREMLVSGSTSYPYLVMGTDGQEIAVPHIDSILTADFVMKASAEKFKRWEVRLISDFDPSCASEIWKYPAGYLVAVYRGDIEKKVVATLCGMSHSDLLNFFQEEGK